VELVAVPNGFAVLVEDEADDGKGREGDERPQRQCLRGEACEQSEGHARAEDHDLEPSHRLEEVGERHPICDGHDGSNGQRRGDIERDRARRGGACPSPVRADRDGPSHEACDDQRRGYRQGERADVEGGLDEGPSVIDAAHDRSAEHRDHRSGRR